MNLFLIIAILLVINSNLITSQYYPHNYPMSYNRYDEMHDSDYNYRSHHSKYRKHNHYNRFDTSEYSESSEESKCSCRKCDDPSPQCRGECDVCQPITQQPSIVLMPIPYLVVLPPNNSISNGVTSTTETSQETTTTPSSTADISTTTTTTSSEPPITSKISKLSKGCNHKPRAGLERDSAIESQSIPSLRRMRPTWMSKYGIVPIPDNLAEKLLSQLREIKSLRQNP